MISTLPEDRGWSEGYTNPFDGSGTITAIQVMDGGSAYEVGNTLAVTGTATTTGYSEAVVKVDNIYNNVGDNIRISGVSSALYSGYNDLYRVTSINSEKSIVGERIKRSEGLIFKACYQFHKFLTLSFTGKSIKYGDEVSGHYVQGHVDTTGKVVGIKINNKTWILKINLSF